MGNSRTLINSGNPNMSIRSKAQALAKRLKHKLSIRPQPHRYIGKTQCHGAICEPLESRMLLSSGSIVTIDYQGFDVLPAESIVFNEPDVNAQVLNRITNGSAVTLDGSASNSGSGTVNVTNQLGVTLTPHLVTVTGSADLVDGDTSSIAALIATPGLLLGRLANFINGELWGEPWRGEGEAPAWTVKYPEEALYNPGAFQLEQLRSVVGGDESFHERVVMEAQAGNQTVIDVLQPQLTPFYPSQLLQALTDGPILLGALVLVWLRPRKPGVVAGCFLMFYGMLRTATEFFRQPDEGVSLLLGLSRGQQLSLLQVLIGLLLLVWCATRRVERVGGLLTTRPGRG